MNEDSRYRAPTSKSMSFAIRQVTTCDEEVARQIAEVHQLAFAGPPYFEAVDIERAIQEVVFPHLPFCLLVAESADKIVGMACAHPFSAHLSAEPREYLLGLPQSDLPGALEDMVYLSENAVLAEFRGIGIGGAFIQQRVNWARDQGYVGCMARTAEIGSNSKRILERQGFQLLPFVQDVTSEKIQSSSDRRIWLCRKTR